MNISCYMVQVRIFSNILKSENEFIRFISIFKCTYICSSARARNMEEGIMSHCNDSIGREGCISNALRGIPQENTCEELSAQDFIVHQFINSCTSCMFACIFQWIMLNNLTLLSASSIFHV